MRYEHCRSLSECAASSHAGDMCVHVSALGAVVEAQEAGCRILGRVQDLTGMPASGASITIRGPAEPHSASRRGRAFVVESLPDGKYRSRQRWKVLRRAARPIEIVNGATGCRGRADPGARDPL